jgi:phosphate transport system substrate-binding protein
MPGHRLSAQLPLLLGATVLMGACRQDTRESLTLAGSTSLQPLAERWADAYVHRRPHVSITIQGGGSTAGVRAVLSGAAQIGMASRELAAQELRAASGVVVARDGIALVVHPSNPVSDLTLAQVRSIYAGRVKSWGKLGGRNRAITTITREEGSGTRGAFESLVMAGRPIAAWALVSDSTGAVRQMVRSDPAALGYISIGLVDAGVKALRLSGVAATEADIDSGRYPLVRPFMFVLPSKQAPLVGAFLAWVLGPEGRELARREGMLPPKAEGPHASR